MLIEELAGIFAPKTIFVANILIVVSVGKSTSIQVEILLFNTLTSFMRTRFNAQKHDRRLIDYRNIK